MKLFSNIDIKQKIIGTLIILLFIGNIIYKNRRAFFDPNFDKETDKMWADRHKKAEKPLKKFNDDIFSKIEFRGVIVDNHYSRTGDVDLSNFSITEINDRLNSFLED